MNVFLSSVIQDFRDYRAAARSAVELMGGRPVMAEDFGAQAYSSEKACITEVEQADVYIVILGERYGFITPDGLSVTEAEYEAANRVGKPMLAFVKAGEMDERQQAFRTRVEDYCGGLFRATFHTAEELKDQVIKGLRNLERSREARSGVDFEKRIREAYREMGDVRRGDSEVVVCLWPQPVHGVDVVLLEQELDRKFAALAASGLATLRDGFKPDIQRTCTGLLSGETRIAWFEDGLCLVRRTATSAGSGYSFSNYYVSPERIRNTAMAMLQMVQVNSAWCHIELRNMAYAKVMEPPRERTTSVTLRSFSVEEDHVSELLIPLTLARYKDFIEKAVRRFQRTFS